MMWHVIPSGRYDLDDIAKCSFGAGAQDAGVRSRPSTEQSRKESSEDRDGNSVTIEVEDGVDKNFVVDRVFWSDPDQSGFASQPEVAEYLASHVCQSALEGHDSCVMAYGQTGAGKTFSLHGAPEMHGALPVLLQMLDGLAETSLRMSVVESYNEELCDLLVDTPSQCRLRESPEGDVYVENLTKLDVADGPTALMVLEDAWKRRAVRGTMMGEQSSRSISIVILETTIQDGAEEFPTKHFLVDWAGSERPPLAAGDLPLRREVVRTRLATNSLHNVVTSLADPRHRYIPYRDSKTTRLLKNAFGNAMDRTLLLGCLSPAEINSAESLSTLRFLNRFHNIPCKTRPPRRNAEEFVLRLGGAMVKPAASAASRRVVPDVEESGSD